MSGKLITFSTNKGGVGKTTLATNIVSDFAIRNPDKNICLIDTDGQCGISIMLGISPHDNTDKSILSFIKGDVELEKIASNEIFKYDGNKIENLYFIPSDLKLRKFDRESGNDSLLETNLIDTIKNLKESFDYVFIDCSPNISIIHELIYKVADLIIAPFDPEAQSIEGVMRVIECFRDNKSKHRPYIGLIPIKIKSNANLSLHAISYVKTTLVKEEVKWNNKIIFFNTYIPFSNQYQTIVARDSIPLMLSKSKAKAVETQKELIRSISDKIIQLLK